MNEMTTLANIERRISFHIQGAYANILEVGRCLIEAKEGGLVPHGQWGEWVKRTAGMSERSAQRLMQAAREVSPDSAMARLPISKITAILALPEPQREAIAEKAVEDNLSIRELNETIEAMKATLDGARQTEARLMRERDTAIEINDRMKRELEAAKKKTDTGISAEALTRIEALQYKERTNREQIKSLENLNMELSDQCDRLTEQLRDAEQMAEYQAQEREKAQQELLDMRTQAARGELPGHDDQLADVVGLAARTFMGTVGFVPHSDRLLTMNDGERDEIATYAAMLREWSENVLQAVNMARNTMVIEGV